MNLSAMEQYWVWLSSVEGIGPKMAEVLQKAGFTSAQQLADATPEHLSTVQGIGEKTAAKIIEGAKKYIAAQAGQTEPAAQEVADDQENN